MRTYLPLIGVLGLATLLSPACDGGASAGGDAAAPGLVLATAPLGDCAFPNGDNRFPDGASKVVLRLSGGNIAADEPIIKAVSRLAAGGVVELAEIEPGPGVTLDVVACDAAGPLWSGVTRDITIPEPGESVEAEVYLTRVDTITRAGRCPSGTELHDGHAFAATARTDSETAWIVGGFATSLSSATTTGFRATAAVERYDRVSSTFADGIADLCEPRGLALAQPMADGRIRVVGGATELVLSNDGPHLYPSGAPDFGVEFYDPEAADSGGGGCAQRSVALTLPPLPALVGFDSGVGLAVGGADGAGGGVASAWILPADLDEASDAVEVTLDEPRFGATVIAADAAAGALVFGGRHAFGAEGAGVWIDVAAGSATTLAGSASQGSATYAAGAYLGESGGLHHFLVVGGTDVNDDGAGNPSFLHNTVTQRMERVAVDVVAGTMTASQVSVGADGPLFQRAFGSLVRVDASTLWLVGGFASFGKNEDVCGKDVEICIPKTLPRFAVGIDGAPVMALATPTVGLDAPALPGDLGGFGAGALELGDGSWLVIPGFDRTGVSADTDAAMARFVVGAASLCDTPVPLDEE